MSIIVEIRAGEGGEDARLLVQEQVSIYAKYAVRKGLTLETLEQTPGLAVLKVSGPSAKDAFRHEGGSFKWQRVPPTEKRGRVHSSTVSVAVLPVPTEASVRLEERDLVWQATRSRGPGGQSVNTTDSAVQLTHKPSGLMVRVETERSQRQNRAVALEILRSRLAADASAAASASRNQDRRAQVGTAMRADKRRTIALQRGEVVDHKLGRRVRAQDYLAGRVDLLVE